MIPCESKNLKERELSYKDIEQFILINFVRSLHFTIYNRFTHTFVKDISTYIINNDDMEY